MPKYDTEEGYVGDGEDSETASGGGGGGGVEAGASVSIHALAIEYTDDTGCVEKYRFGFSHGNIVAIRRETQPESLDSFVPSGLIEWRDVPTPVRNELQEELPQAELHHVIDLDTVASAARS